MVGSLDLLLRLAFTAMMYLFLLQLITALRRESRRTLAESRLPTPHLVVVEVGGSSLAAGQRIAIWPDTLLGRADTADVQIDDQAVSGRHAKLTRRGQEWWLEDLNSTNGTCLDGRRIDAPVRLAAGDFIDLGRVRLRWEFDEPDS